MQVSTPPLKNVLSSFELYKLSSQTASKMVFVFILVVFEYLLWWTKPGIMKLELFKFNLTLKVKVNQSQNNMDLNQGVLHILSEFGLVA